jgi:hypothetical protein
MIFGLLLGNIVLGLTFGAAAGVIFGIIRDGSDGGKK